MKSAPGSGEKDTTGARVEGRRRDACLKFAVSQEPGRESLQYKLDVPDLGVDGEVFESATLQGDLTSYLRQLFLEIEDIPLRTQVEFRIAEKKVGNLGLRLSRDVLPLELGDRLWQLRHEIGNLRVEADELWIPWELFRLRGRVDGRDRGGLFLGETFRITRLPRGSGGAPVLPLRNIAVVLASDAELSDGEEEVEFMKSLEQEGRAVERIPAQFLAIQEAFESGRFDAWHFVGHGNSDEERQTSWSLDLEDTELSPDDIGGWIGGSGQRAPLIFMNACKTGQGGQSLTRVEGWARAFLDVGAGAFIGASWSTNDSCALVFARAFYSAFIDGSALGEAVRAARLCTRESLQGDPSWLAYCAVGDPLASISRAEVEAPAGGSRRGTSSRASRWLIVAGSLGILGWTISEYDPRSLLGVGIGTRAVPLIDSKVDAGGGSAEQEPKKAPTPEVPPEVDRSDREEDPPSQEGSGDVVSNVGKEQPAPEMPRVLREVATPALRRCVPRVNPDMGGFTLEFDCEESDQRTDGTSGAAEQ